MTINVSSRTLIGRPSVPIGALLAAIAVFTVSCATAEVSPRESILAIQRQVESIQPRLVKSTVIIKMSDGSGSGVIISQDGFVLTAGHVVEGRQGRRVTTVLSDGRSFSAAVVASNRASDLGIVKIVGAEGLPTAPLGDSSMLRRGQWVLATGHPLGQHQGRPPVLRIGRVLSAFGGGMGRDSITTDAPIISGDSGGPLFDLNGRIVGINSMITTGGPRMASIHVPINLAKAAVARSVNGETPDTWDGPADPFAHDIRDGRAALRSGDVGAALRLAKEAAAIDPTSAAARLLLARADARSGQPQLALTALGEACDRGFNDPEIVRNDPDFIPLMRQDTMTAILGRLDALNGVPGQRKNDLTALASGTPPHLGQGVVRLQSSGLDVALGTVMSADGDVLTKASELPEGPITCIMPDGHFVPAERRAVDSTWDVALLKVNTAGLKTVSLTNGAVVGEWTFSPDSTGSLAAIGIVGVSEMPVHGRGIAAKPTSKAYMGVRLDPVRPETLKDAGVANGVFVTVQAGLPADQAGLETGDIVYELDDQPIRDTETFMDLLVPKKPGETVKLRLVRGTQRMTIHVPLVKRPPNTAGRNGLPEDLSGDVSRMQGPFSQVIHHDSVLRPNAMGGPLIDAEGHCIGLNIARADRTSTYAIAARDLREIYSRLKASP